MICSSTVGGCEHVPSRSVAIMAKAAFKCAVGSGARGAIAYMGAGRATGRRHMETDCRKSGRAIRRFPPADLAYRIAALLERYRSGHNGADSKSVEGITSLRGFDKICREQILDSGKAGAAGAPRRD